MSVQLAEVHGKSGGFDSFDAPRRPFFADFNLSEDEDEGSG